MKRVYLALYYAFFQFWPMSPFPLYSMGYWMRYFLLRHLLRYCGSNVVVKSKAYVGDGSRISIGNNSQLGMNCRLNGDIEIGDNVLMGPDVVIMATSHRYDSIDIPMIDQGEAQEKPVRIGSDVWIGTRVVILPGVTIGDKSIIGAGAVVAKNVSPGDIVVGNPGRVVKNRLTSEF